MDGTLVSPNLPHVAICPSAGIGHLTPFLRLASMLASLSSNTCKVTLVIIRPSLSSAEANQITTFLATHPHINSFEFHSDPPTTTTHGGVDPFLLQYQAVTLSAHRLTRHLAALSPPLSAVFSDLLLASGLSQALADMGINNYTVITTSARFFSFMANVPHLTGLAKQDVDVHKEVEIPGLGPIPKTDIPPPFLDPNNILNRIIDANCRCLNKAKGIIINTFDLFEPESIQALQGGKVLSDLPPVFPIGPLHGLPSNNKYPSWLDQQPCNSVVYVSFGSRTPMSKEQIRELGDGLERSGARFLWVIKTAIVDKEDKEEIRDFLGDGFLERTKDRGLVVKEWVSQDEILALPSVGGFVTHCGWNSVMEAAQRGVPLLAWPQHGDQRFNAGVVVKAGLGIWESGWGWGGSRLVRSGEIAEKVVELMTSEKLRESAKRVGEEARKAWEIDGSSSLMFKAIVDKWKMAIEE